MTIGDAIYILTRTRDGEGLGDETDDALDMAIEALQKDIPIKVAKSKEPRFGMGYEYYDWVCPTCGWYLAPEPAIKDIPRRCGYCGQLLERVEE